jgi:hypothetical protein
VSSTRRGIARQAGATTISAATPMSAASAPTHHLAVLASKTAVPNVHTPRAFDTGSTPPAGRVAFRDFCKRTLWSLAGGVQGVLQGLLQTA